jgi:hypothetical protein
VVRFLTLENLFPQPADAGRSAVNCSRMDHAIINCHEEEFAPFFAYAWRRPSGWRPVFFYGRGPAGIGLISGLFLTAIGIWRFARNPAQLHGQRSDYIGQRVLAVVTCLGSYGMGGPGFFGVRFRKGWIVYRLWGADGWLTLNGKLIEESLFPDEREPIGKHNLISASQLKGSILRATECGDDQYDLAFVKNDENLCLSVRRDGSAVPHWRGNGSPKVFADNESLEDAVIVSRTGRIWLPD